MITKEELKSFVKIFNQRHRGSFHQLRELEPRIYKARYRKNHPLRNKIVYYEKGETNEDFFFVEAHIKEKLRIWKELGELMPSL